jgi:hypothetical protein
MKNHKKTSSFSVLLTFGQNMIIDGNMRKKPKMNLVRDSRETRVMSEPRKGRGLARFRKREITRAFEGVPGATSIEIFPADGRIVVHRANPADAPSSRNPWDDVHVADTKRAS